MRSPLALTVMTWLLRPKPAWASPAVHLVPRQFCDSIVCDPNVDNWFTGIFGGALEWLDNTFQLELPNSSPITGDSKKDVRNPDTPASAQPGDEIFVQDGQHAGSRRCDATAPPTPSPQGTTSVSHIFKTYLFRVFRILMLIGRKLQIYIHANRPNNKRFGQNPAKT